MLRNALTLLGLVLLLPALGCVKVHVDPVEATLNVNIRNMNDDLDSYFAYESPEKYPLFNDLKAQGKIGETNLGYVAAVQAEFLNDHVVKTIVEGVNQDRVMIYGTLAKKGGTPVEKIAETNAQRNFRAAKAGAWLQTPEGWKQKE